MSSHFSPRQKIPIGKEVTSSPVYNFAKICMKKFEPFLGIRSNILKRYRASLNIAECLIFQGCIEAQYSRKINKRIYNN